MITYYKNYVGFGPDCECLMLGAYSLAILCITRICCSCSLQFVRAAALAFDLVSLIRFPSKDLACSSGIKVLDLNGTIMQFGGSEGLHEVTGNDIPGGVVGIGGGEV